MGYSASTCSDSEIAKSPPGLSLNPQMHNRRLQYQRSVKCHWALISLSVILIWIHPWLLCANKASEPHRALIVQTLKPASAAAEVGRGMFPVPPEHFKHQQWKLHSLLIFWHRTPLLIAATALQNVIETSRGLELWPTPWGTWAHAKGSDHWWLPEDLLSELINKIFVV